jgi:hypothetical protein
MQSKQIAILLVQEAHMHKERRETVEKVFTKRLRITASTNPKNLNAQAGVAVVLNKELINTKDLETKEVRDGH